MNLEKIISIAPHYVAVNVNSEVEAATVSWDELDSTLVLTYYVGLDPSDDVENLCDLALTELLEEFLEVKKADIRVQILSADQDPKSLAGLVYLKGG